MVTAIARGVASAEALVGPEEAHGVIARHLRSDAGGRCLECAELEPCRARNTAHAALFGHDRQLPRRRPLALIGPTGDFGTDRFDAFGKDRL